MVLALPSFRRGPAATEGDSSSRQTVVDGRLKVHGVDRLRVADASIFPAGVVGNTNQPAVIVGLRACNEPTNERDVLLRMFVRETAWANETGGVSHATWHALVHTLIAGSVRAKFELTATAFDSDFDDVRQPVLLYKNRNKTKRMVHTTVRVVSLHSLISLFGPTSSV